MTSLTDDQAVLFGVPSEYRELVLIKDVVPLEGGKQIVLIRTKVDYRDTLRLWLVKANPALEADLEAQNEAMKKPFAIDTWDSGIQYFVEEIEGKLTAQIISKIDSYTHKIVAQPSLIRAELDYQLKLDDTTRFRAWEEGTVITVKTVTINGEPRTFYSTRNKINAEVSRWSNKAGTPTYMEEFWSACNRQGITRESIETSGICHAFILKSPWNATQEKIAKAQVVHFRSYAFGAGGRYSEIEEEVPGAIPVRVFNIAEAVEHVKNGGVVMTMYSFNNIKFMSTDTQMLYSWFENSHVSTPDEQYFKLLTKDKGSAQRYQRLLNPYMREALDTALRNLESNIHATAEYIRYCLNNAIKLRQKEKSSKIEPKDKAPFHENGTIAYIIRNMMNKHGESVKEAKAEATVKVVRGRKMQTKRQPKKKTDELQLEGILEILRQYERDDPVKLVKLIRACAKLRNTDIARLRAREAREEQARRPVTPTFDSKAQKELANAMKLLESISIIEVDVAINSDFDVGPDRIYVPAQYDEETNTPTSSEKWVRTETKVVRRRREDGIYIPPHIDRNTGEVLIPERWVPKDDIRSPETFSDDE